MILDEEIFDKETIENLQYIAAVSGDTITRTIEAFEQLCILMSEQISESVKTLESIFKDIEEIANNPPDDIPALKKQIKYCKNPMEIRMLNKRLNEAYKKNIRRKRNEKIK